MKFLVSGRGLALVDLVVTCAVAAVIAGIAVPSLHATRERDASRMAAQHLAGRMQAARLEALKRNAHVALRFDPDDVGRIRAYVDGDGDGVLQQDIDSGIDPPLAASLQLSDFFGSVALRVAHDVPDPDGGGGVLLAGSDAIRIGATNLLSFSPLGSAGSGTIYLSGRGGPQVCVRVLGATGRVRVLWYDARTDAWRQD